MLYLKELQNEQESRESRRKEIIKVRAEINDMEAKIQYKRSMKPRTGSLKR